MLLTAFITVPSQTLILPSTACSYINVFVDSGTAFQ